MLRIPLGIVLSASFAATVASAQPSSPDQGPFANPPAPAMPAPAPTAPPAVVTSEPATREEQLEARIRQLESMVNRLSTQMNQKPAAGTGPAAAGSGTGSAAPDVGSPASAVAPASAGGVGAPGQSLPPNPAPSKRFDSPATLESKKGNFKFGPGFELRTDDDEYILQFHNLTQLDFRGYEQGGQTPVHDTFDFPRQWWMFSGRISKPIGFFTSIANGFDVISLLDVFLDLDFNPKLRARIGRMKTPFTYEFLVEPIQGLVVPERSVFFNNFGQNRDLGIMAFGRILGNTVDYAGGIFNGTRNGFLAQQDNKATSWFVNWKPFGQEENTLLENFNIGGSVFAANQNQIPVPQQLRTVVATTGNQIIGVPFLNFNNNVKEFGPMAFWDLHTAYFLGGLAVVAEWGSGFQDYSINNSNRVRVPVDSYYVQASYLITGETRSNIKIVKPLNPVTFGRGKGWSGTGAWEPYARFESMDIGNQVFTGGLADPNLWANRMYQTHVGFNWHLTQYLKFYFDWNHSEFNQPVLFAPGRRQLTSDLFMARLQLYF
jgi:phosphate-selective porin OprO/OprP